MSAQSSGKEIDPNRLVETIIDKTKAGKLNWQDTALENCYIVSVGGNTTIQVWEEIPEPENLNIDPEFRQPYEHREGKWLELRDESGRAFMKVGESEVPAVEELFKLARRKAIRDDERIQSFVEVLQRL
jgi:hypothetical protein